MLQNIKALGWLFVDQHPEICALVAAVRGRGDGPDRGEPGCLALQTVRLLPARAQWHPLAWAACCGHVRSFSSVMTVGHLLIWREPAAAASAVKQVVYIVVAASLAMPGSVPVMTDLAA